MTLFEEMFLIFLGSIEVSQALKSTQLRWQWDDIEACLSHEKGEKWHRKYEVTWHETVQGPKKMAQELRLHGSYGDAISLQSVFVSRDFSNSNCLRILPKWQGHGCCYGAGLEEANLPRGINHLYRNHGYILMQRELTYTVPVCDSGMTAGGVGFFQPAIWEVDQLDHVQLCRPASWDVFERFLTDSFMATSPMKTKMAS